jgi:hypothetical protein
MKKRLIAATLVVAALVLSTAAKGYADASEGPRTHSDRVYAKETRIWKITFIGGRTASVAVVGDGYANLDLYIYDLDGRLVAKDENLTSFCKTTWRPQYTETFFVEVVNRGLLYSNYALATN